MHSLLVSGPWSARCDFVAVPPCKQRVGKAVLSLVTAMSIDVGSYRGYFQGMKSVGIKMLKNNLSKYLKLVRKGETILVTDRNEVIAEIRRPSESGRTDRLQAFLEEEARLGHVTLATTRNPDALEQLRALPRPRKPIDIQALMDEIRQD